MIAHSIFLFFSVVAIVSAIMVTASKNTVHSVFFDTRLYKHFLSFYYDWSRVFRNDNVNCLCWGCSCSVFICSNDVKCSPTKNQWFASESSSSHIPMGLIISGIIFLN